MAARKSSRSRSSSFRTKSIGCLFWLCLLAIIAAVAYAARGQLSDTFARLVGGRAPADSRQTVTRPEVTREPLDRDVEPRRVEGGTEGGGGGTEANRPPAAITERVAPPSRPTAAAQAEKPAIRKTRLFFLSVDPNGAITMRGVIRPIPQSDSPLRDALDTLLKGPTAQEINLGLMTMIPSGTALRGVTVRGDVAYIDFSESFRFNSLGLDGMRAQLRQVVYAATEFPTVKKVQLLIEGKKVDYLGTEGVRIDQPLARSEF